jgi:hypothetical protein
MLSESPNFSFHHPPECAMRCKNDRAKVTRAKAWSTS